MVLKLRSPAIAPGGHIPAKYTCDGSDLSPPLRWTDPPSNTERFALIVAEPEALGGTADLKQAATIARDVPGVRELKIVEVEPLPPGVI